MHDIREQTALFGALRSALQPLTMDARRAVILKLLDSYTTEDTERKEHAA